MVKILKKIMAQIDLPARLGKFRQSAPAWAAAARALGSSLWPKIRLYGPPALLGLLALTAALAVVRVRPRFVESYQARQTRRNNRPRELLRRGEMLAADGRTSQAFEYMRQSIDLAERPADRAAAGGAMGLLLLDYARVQPTPYAQMARSYLEAAVALEPDAGRRVGLYAALSEAAALMDDSRAVVKFCESGMALADQAEQKVDFILARLDALMRVGVWAELAQAWEAASPYRDQPEWRNSFALREARIIEGALSRRDWYEELARRTSGGQDPVALRQALFQKALRIYDRLAAEDEELADAASFRGARLCSAENQFQEARHRIARYFTRDYSDHNEDIMLLLTRMVRLEGQHAETERLISLCLERFDWASRTEPQIMELVDAADSVGHYPEALYYLEEYLTAVERRSDSPRLLFKAGQLAARQQRYADALAYYNEALQAGPDDAMYVGLLLALAEVNMHLGDLPAAQDALVTALTRFPYDPRRGRMLYQLVDLFSRSDAPLSDVLLVTSLAVNVAPNNPAAVGVLLQMARIYETLGLFDQAQARYAQVALLRTVTADPDVPALPVSEALLGSARCLMEMGDMLRADRVLRELCQTSRGDHIQSSAAYLWATIALRAGQYQEARRRLALVDLAHCRPDVRARVQLDGMLIDVAMERRSPEALVDYLKNIVVLDADERADYIRRAYAYAFERTLEQESPAAVQAFIDRAMMRSKVVPVTSWVMRLAARLLEEEGVPAFIDCLQDNLVYVGSDIPEAPGEVDALIELALSLENTKERVWEQLQ